MMTTGLNLPIETSFTVFGRTLAAQVWGASGCNPTAKPVIALHGWLDNAASFHRLAPLLVERSQGQLKIIALDLSGHGLSDHRQPGQPYNIWQDVADIFTLADSQGWDSFSLIGHSRGAIVSALCAGTFPERIRHLALIDGLWPAPVDMADSPALLARSIADLSHPRKARHRVYNDIETMIWALCSSRWRLNRETAEALVVRGVRKVEGGYIWRADPLLKIASAFKLSQAHIDAFAARIIAPSQLIIASSGLPDLLATYHEDVQRIVNARVAVLDGGHHLHTEGAAEQVADLFWQLFA